MCLRKLMQPEDCQKQHSLNDLESLVDHPAVNISVDTDIWCSAARPSDPGFAVGLTGRMNVLFPRESGWDMSECRRSQRINLSKNDRIHAIDWLDSNVILQGIRTGKVLLMDLRSQCSAPRLQHPEGINYVRALDQNRIVVAGVKNRVCLQSQRLTIDCKFDLISITSFASMISDTYQMNSQGMTPAHISSSQLITVPTLFAD